MTVSIGRDWKSPVLTGLAVLVLGSGVMGTEWALKKQAPGIPGWTSFTGTTVGDTLLLPVLAASLVAAFRYLPATGRGTEKYILRFGAFTGALGGLAVQLSWLLDDKPRLSWVLPRAHHFSLAGYYHAIFLIAASGTSLARRSHLAPAAVVAGSLVVFSLVIANLAEAPQYPWWLAWAAVGAALVSIWQVESIIGNAAMRPRWLVRREWRHEVAISVALAVGSLTLTGCTDGMVSPAGGSAESLASLLIFFGEVSTGLILVMAAGWALDWQPGSIAGGRAIASGGDSGEPNWARYRLRGCLLMDFGLIQGLTTVGIWLPSLAIAHIGLSSQDRFF
jgi:hypothetical protein